MPEYGRFTQGDVVVLTFAIQDRDSMGNVVTRFDNQTMIYQTGPHGAGDALYLTTPKGEPVLVNMTGPTLVSVRLYDEEATDG